MNDLNNLLPDTKKILVKLATLPLLQEFTFVDGSALAIYLGHRLSEDIDLFTWHKQLPIADILNALTANHFKDSRIINLTPTHADYVLDGVKVTFFANGGEELKNRQQLLNNVFIATLPTLAIMKVNTLFLRAKNRDYYDVYVLNLEHYSLQQLFEMTISKMQNLIKTLFQRALIFTDDITDENIQHLAPKYNIFLSEISKHFQKQIKSWNKTQK